MLANLCIGALVLDFTVINTTRVQVEFSQQLGFWNDNFLLSKHTK